MAMPADTALRWTPDAVRALPDDGNRHECVGGELLVTPAPTRAHQRVVLALYRLIDAHVRAHGLGEVVLAPADLQLDDFALVQPDLFVVPPDGGAGGREWRDITRVTLAVEVTSPGTARHDRGAKRDLYQRWRVDEYWIVDVDARVVERWRPEDARPEVLRERLEWAPSSGAPPLGIELDALLREALGD